MRNWKHLRNRKKIRRKVMSRFKKIFCLLVAAVMIIGCVACNAGETEHTTHTWENGECTVCHEKHTGHTDTDKDGKCDTCGAAVEAQKEPETPTHKHTWVDGVCSECHEECEHETYTAGKCDECGEDCEHLWNSKTGKCFYCSTEHNHDWNTSNFPISKCKVCNYECPHPTHDPATEICKTCGILAGHWFEGGFEETKNCTRCNATTDYEVDMPAYVKTDVADASKRGTIEYFEYKVNTGANEYTKHAYVYVPAGYSPTEKYNVVYFLHGGGGSAEDYFCVTNSNAKQILDHLIADGDTEKTLVVTPTYQSNQAKDSDIPHGASAFNTINKTKMEADYPESYAAAIEKNAIRGHADNAGKQTVNFTTEIRQYLIPQFEAKYAAYGDQNGDGTVSDEEIVATRQHRALCGYSAGAMNTYSAGLIGNTEAFAYYGSFAMGASAGSGGGPELIAKLESDPSKYHLSFYYCGIGGADPNFPTSAKPYSTSLIKANSAELQLGVNYAYVVKLDHAHTTVAILIDLYNCLKNDFFKHDTENVPVQA